MKREYKPQHERRNCTLVIKRGNYRRQWNSIKEAYALSQFENLVTTLEFMQGESLDVKGYRVYILRSGNQIKQRNF